MTQKTLVVAKSQLVHCNRCHEWRMHVLAYLAYLTHVRDQGKWIYVNVQQERISLNEVNFLQTETTIHYHWFEIFHFS